MQIRPLETIEEYMAINTISTQALFYLVGAALVQKRGLSLVRMGDGEVQLFKDCQQAILQGRGEKVNDTSFTPEWRQRMGIEGLNYQTLHDLMVWAAHNCDYFCPNVNGITNHAYALWPHINIADNTQRLADNFWVNAWTDEHRLILYREAKHVLLVHSNLATADALQKRLKNLLGVKMTFLQMVSHSGAQSVVDAASNIDAPLVLFSGGPASKWIGPIMARQGKIALDIGNSIDQWTLSKVDSSTIVPHIL